MDYLYLELHELPEIIFAHTFQTENYVNKIPARNNTLEITYVKQGSISLTRNNGIVETCCEKTVHFGSFNSETELKYNGYHVHDTFAIRCDMKIIELSASAAAEMSCTNPSGFILPHNITDRFLSSYIAKSIENIIVQYHSESITAHLFCTSIIFSVFAKANEYAMSKLQESVYVSPNEKKYVDKMISYVNKNFIHRLTVDEISSHAGLSRSYASRLFSKITNRSIVDYINLKRVEYIKELIRYKNSNASQICEILNFCDEKYICRVFKQYTGLTMREYRRISENTDYNNSLSFNFLM